MVVVTANELKRRGVSSIEDALRDEQEVAITVRGRPRYVVVTPEHYERLRQCELEAALLEVREDLAAGRYAEKSVDEHVAEVTGAV